jgi:hypothetical protein
MEVIWNYLHGTAFKQRVEAIIEAFSAMNTNLAKEENVITRMWAERKKQIESETSTNDNDWLRAA